MLSSWPLAPFGTGLVLKALGSSRNLMMLQLPVRQPLAPVDQFESVVYS
jgi:hypothetical protein